MKTILVLVSLLLSGAFTTQARAQSEPPERSGEPALSVRQLPNSDYEAVVTYGTDQYCILTATPPSSIEIVGNDISIESPSYGEVGPCIGPTPPFLLFEQVAELGALAQGEYTVEWVQAAEFSLATTFEVTGTPPQPISNANPYPESGLWYNPDESGTGFDLEVQNGIMAGHYFGYNSDGEPEWFMISGPLTQSMTEGVLWELEVAPERYTGGNCFGCAYQPPNAPVQLAPIKFEFMQRAQLKLTLSDDSIQYMVPIIYGDDTTPVVTDHVTLNIPTFAAGSSQWVIAFKDNDETTQTSAARDSYVVQINSPQFFPEQDSSAAMSVYAIVEVGAADDALALYGEIICEQNADVCYLTFSGRTPFEIPVGNFTDARFFGNAANSNTAQGFRLNYD